MHLSIALSADITAFNVDNGEALANVCGTGTESLAQDKGRIVAATHNLAMRPLPRKQ